MTISPLLSIGALGTHIIGNARGYAFVGTVPSGIKQGGYASEQDALAAFVAWFKRQDADFQRSHIADLRNDVFALVLTA